MSLLGWLIFGALVGAVVYEAYVSYITKKSAIQAAEKVMTSDEFARTLKARIKEKSSNAVKLEMLDSSSNTICEVKISGESVSSEMRCSDIIYV